MVPSAFLTISCTSMEPQAGLVPDNSLSGADPVFLMTMNKPPEVGKSIEGLPQALSIATDGAAAGAQPAAMAINKKQPANLNQNPFFILFSLLRMMMNFWRF
jgi:hypothetical protein